MQTDDPKNETQDQPTPESDSHKPNSSTPKEKVSSESLPTHELRPDSSSPTPRGKLVWMVLLNVFLFTSIILAIIFLIYKSKDDEHGFFIPMVETPKIAVVNLTDTITYDYVAPIIQWIDALSRNPSVKGMVVRVNCPGGTVAASQELYQALLRFKQRNEGHQVYISSIDLNASGAYWVSCSGDRIFANPGSTVGSIGVIRAGLSFQGLMEKVGVKNTTITSVEYKDIGSMYKDMSESERDFLKSEIESLHQQFVEIVYQSRQNIQGLTREKLVNEIAIGLTFTGTQALENGLVDDLKSFPAVIELMKEEMVARQLAPSYEAIELIYPPEPAFDLRDLWHLIGLMANRSKSITPPPPTQSPYWSDLPSYASHLPLLLYTGALY
jgi:signal peptide peptidase SppA